MAEPARRDASIPSSRDRWQRIGTVATVLVGVVVMFVVLDHIRDTDGPATIAELAAGGDPATEPFADFTSARFALDTEPFCTELLVADTVAERTRGLSRIPTVAPYGGMLFVFDTDTDVTFTMRDTRIPLTIAWYDAEGGVVDLQNMSVPANESQAAAVYRAAGPYRYAVEVPQGDPIPNLLETC